MSSVDIETKRTVREINGGDMLQAIEAQGETWSTGLTFEERVRLIVDKAHSEFATSQVDDLIRCAKLRYPNADLRQVDLIEERGLNRNTLTAIGSCAFIEQNQKTFFQGFIGSKKSNLGCDLTKQACRNRIRTQYVRMPDLRKNVLKRKTSHQVPPNS